MTSTESNINVAMNSSDELDKSKQPNGCSTQAASNAHVMMYEKLHDLTEGHSVGIV